METKATTVNNVGAGSANDAQLGDKGLPWPPKGYAWYVVSVLTAAYTLSFVDRQVLGLLLESIRRDLSLTDTQVSLLVGSAFALFYARSFQTTFQSRNERVRSRCISWRLPLAPAWPTYWEVPSARPLQTCHSSVYRFSAPEKHGR